MNDNMSLLQVSESDLDRLEKDLKSASGTGEYQWFGFTSINRVRQRFAESGLIDSNGGMLALVAGNEVVGRVEWFKSFWGRADTSLCWTIAVAIYPEQRGHGYGTQGHRKLVEYLFRNTRAERIQAYTDVDNQAERGALRSAGFSQEGVLRSAQWRSGSWHDQALYSILRSE